ncbi:MAG: response regulator [Deltaproteobacteria bacterium]|nr:response regulator [Deltaproteobacteria bacterium]
MTGRVPGEPERLRRAAEARVQSGAAAATVPVDLEGSLRLVHELRVHQVELELQNEELRRTREELEASLVRYADLYDHAPVGYLTLDGRGLIEEVNLAAAGLLGLPRAQLVGAAIASFLQPASRGPFAAFLEEVRAGGATRSLEARLGGPGGAATPVLLEALAISAGARPAGSCRLVLVDVGDMRRLEDRLRVAQRLEAVALLAAGVAHEINNPLAYLLEGMHFLQRELEAPGPDLSPLREVARDACDGLERIREVVRSLRTFSTPRSDGLAPVDVGAELAAALRLAGNELRHRARVVTRLDPLPAVLARPRELGQVFLNLLVNAAHACPEARADDHTVTVSAHTDGSGWAVVEVSDSGVGMAPEVVEHIFEPFYTTKPFGLGTGLGLTLSHGIVSAAGGRIEVVSLPGAGSTFRVLLPPAAASDSPPPRGDAVPPGPAPVLRPGARRVLVVDDQPQMARSTARCLAETFAVTVCLSGDEALDLLRRGEAYDAVVCDLMMPQMSGSALQERVAARWPGLASRFVFLTGGAFGPEATAFAERTSAPVLEKPYDPEALVTQLTRLTEGLTPP